MRHRKAGYKLNRTSAHRQAMLRNLAVSLFQHGQITTTRQKAKLLQPFVEKIVTLAKRGDQSARRQVIAKLGGDKRAFDWTYLAKNATDSEKEHVNQLRGRAERFFDIPSSAEVKRNRYGELKTAPKIVKHIFENVAPRFEDRNGGYTRIVKLGYHRLGDAAEVVVIQFVGAEEGPEIGHSGSGSSRRRAADRRTAYYAQLTKGSGAAAAVADEPVVAPSQEDSELAGDAPEAEGGDSGDTKPEA
ncbi:MAG: bL17 family ribosomal protein [Planctomycetota bacterium]